MASNSFLAFDACQCRTKTEMSSVSKSQMPIIFAGNVKPVGIREAFRIAVCRCHHRHDGLPFLDELPAQFYVSRRQSSRVLAGTFVAQHFFDGRRDQREIFPQSFHFFRIAQQR